MWQNRTVFNKESENCGRQGWESDKHVCQDKYVVKGQEKK